jgi:membrane protein DedA with SNARE-associated domain
VAHHLYATLSQFFTRYGYWTIFVTVSLENTGVPAPGDTVVLFAAFVARRGHLSLLWTILIAAIAAILGQCVGFVIGRVGGQAFVQRYRRTLRVSESHYERAQRIFLRNAGWAVFVARFVIVLRELAGILSGVFRLPASSFMLSNISGAVVWSVSMSCLGYFLSQSWKQLVHFFSRMDIVVLILFGIVVLIVVLRQRWAEAAKR